MPAIEELLAQRIPFWHNLIAAEKQDLVSSARVARFAAGEHVQGAGTGCAGVIFMLSGRSVPIFSMNPARRSHSSAWDRENAASSPPRASCP